MMTTDHKVAMLDRHMIYAVQGTFLLYFLLISGLTFPQEMTNVPLPDANPHKIIENGLFLRKIDLKDGTLSTSNLMLKDGGIEIIKPGSKEFSFTVNGEEVYAGIQSPFFKYSGFETEHLPDRERLKISLSGNTQTAASELWVDVYYEFYPDIAGVRKWIVIRNRGNGEIKIENLFWEHLLIDPGYGAGFDIYKDFGRTWTKPPYTGGLYDPAILLKSDELNIILGNEGPGIMKYISIYRKDQEIKIGLNPSDHPYPFRKNLSANEHFRSPESFIILSSANTPVRAFETDLGKYIRDYLGVKLYKRKQKPFFLYNTWNPFRTEINEHLIMELADALENTGVEYMIIDDGWQDHNGDWNVHEDKFPNGLKPVTEYIRGKGMKPGLWFSLSIANAESAAFNNFKHLAVTDKDGNPANLHGWSNNYEILTMKIVSPWYDYIKQKMRQLVLDYGIEYFKIDLAMVKSAYIMDPERSGSYDRNEYFNGREEYLYAAFERTQQLFDELSDEFPELVIDCTFELWGDWHIIDYGLVKHADVDWISNFEAPPPEGSQTVRNLAYDRSLVTPTSCMVIGNQKLEVENHELSFISNFGSMPIMLGDPRKLTAEDKAWYRKMSDWFRRMDELYNISEYYQTGGVFGPPNDTGWDGFFRFNTSIMGGILCVFRNNNPDIARRIIVPFCQPDHTYEIIHGETEESLGRFRGIDLIDTGFELAIEQKNRAVALEIKELQQE